MKFYLLLAISLIGMLPKYAQAQKTDVTTSMLAVDSVLNRVLKNQHVAGFAVAVVKGDSVIYSKGFGYRDVENKKPVTANTLFAVGSSTKAFTAALVGLLEQDGKLKLDDIATNYLPNLRFNNNEMNNNITIRDLMAHRTGLSRYDYSWLLFNTSNRDSIISRVKFMVPTVGIRQKWFYNNYMYLAQGMLVEKISGKTWEQNIKEKFFVPLEMNRSNTDIRAFKNDADASLPYINVKDSVIKKIDYYDINGMGPAGSINSSVNDLAKWLKVWISGGTYQKKEVLPSRYVREAASSQMVIDGALPGKHKDVFLANYGLGWMLSSYRGHYQVEHGGNINGFSASVAFYPTEKVGIVVLTNQNNSQVPYVVRSSIADRLFDLKPIDWNGEAIQAIKAMTTIEKNKQADRKSNIISNTKPSHPIEAYIGSFENPAYGTVKITNDKNTIYASLGAQKLLLKHLHYDVFEPEDINKKTDVYTTSSENLFNFFTNNEGKIDNLNIKLDPDQDPVRFVFKPEAKKINLEILKAYVGEYDLGNVTTKIFLKGDVLFVYVPGQPEYETVPVNNDTFNLKALKGYTIKFESEAGKNVKSVTFIQPNGTFKALRKN